MKKLNKLYICALSGVMLLGACNKELELKPFQQIEQDQAIQSATDVQITLVGAYNRLGQQDLYGGGIYLYPDLMATQTVVDFQGTYQQLSQMVSQTIPVNNSFINNVWLDAYAVINQCNNVIANLDKVAAANKNRTEGEAKFLRGMVYFDLVRLYGRDWNDGDPAANLGVPIVLTPTTVISQSSNVSRSTVAQVYQQAIADLTDAETKLPATNTVYATKFAASAILARLYLQKSDFPNAAAEATKAIAGPFTLNANYADEFPYGGIQGHFDNTPEDIFAVQVTNQQGSNYLNTFYASADNAGRGDIIVKVSFVSEFEPGDTRADIYQEDSDGILRNDKFDNVYGNVHITRLAEMYLIRAEANLRISATSSIGDKPVNDVNKIRVRAGINPLTTVSINDVLTERRHELAFEGGFFFFDAKRLRQNLGALPYNSPKLVFPIPQQDLTANPNLKQNPGY